ncbi:MAG: AMP-dependent synthetase [Actinobacteria bacterium]|jgi:crotonobetaine/carnitine-CoA ligase|nr:MAG: AMP-dependent synthetase [Actinomycetota bacterium]
MLEIDPRDEKHVNFYRPLAGILLNLVRGELRKGTLHKTLLSVLRNRALSVAEGTLLGDLQEEKADENGDRIFLRFKERRLTYGEMDSNSNRVAHGLLSCGISPGEGVAIMMRNCPRFLDAFYAIQKTGMYAVPVNVSLKGEGLVHILRNSDASGLVIDDASWENFQAVRDGVQAIKTVIVSGDEAPEAFRTPSGCLDMGEFYQPGMSATRPRHRPERGRISTLMYTSGTTGLPKGVVWKYGDSRVDLIGALARFLFHGGDNLYTAAPLFHANALFVSGVSAMHANAQFTVSQRFSAGGFWDEMRRYGVTSFNALGSLMEIMMMREPPSPRDRDHRVRLVLAAAITPETWRRFEERYGITVYNAYGAVDTGNGFIANFGNAPKGALGRPLGVKCRVIDEGGGEAAVGELGELQMYLGRQKPVEYFKDEEGTEAKVVGGWVRTGDMVTRDNKGNFYYMGRDIEHMRRRGENITCFDVEREIMKHPAVEECAVYGVPSELGEDEVMAAVILLEGEALDPGDLCDFLQDKLASFQMPRFIRYMDELPKTEIFKVKKKELQKQGVTADAWDREE